MNLRIAMKKFIKRIIMAGVLILSAAGCSAQESEPYIQIRNSNGTETEILSWEDEEGVRHLFLPSYCESAEVSVKKRGDTTNVQYHQSSNVATLFVNTESGSMDAIHADKEYREAAEVKLYTDEGILDFSTSECSLKGRGNTTWEYFDKKPYQLKLDEPADLLGMGNGKKWILLANAFDETHLRNKLVYDIARENDFCYAPECEYVDLYLNGEYRGLYLLTERVEFGEDRLDISAEEKYMCNIEYAVRWDSLENAFLTDHGRAVEVREPDEPSQEDNLRIKEIVQQMEDIILDSEDTDLLEETIDIDSWVYKYLIDEIMENGDADIASSYFYYADGKIFAGPLWDYDNTLGVSTRNQNPCTFMARSGYKGGEHETPYYDALYEKEEFYERMVELYRTEMTPVITEVIHSYLPEEEEKISEAVTMNRVRWREALDEQNSLITDAEGLADYLEKRMEFLDTAWLDGEEYCTVQFQPYVIDMYATKDTYAGSYAVKKGTSLSELLQPLITEAEDVVWVDSETGEVFEPEQIITEDITLRILKNP